MSRDVETVERLIAAPAPKIFALLADASQHQAFDGSGTVREAAADVEPLSLGTRFGMAMHAGLPYKMVNTVVEFEPDRLIAWQPRPAYPVVDRFIGGRIWRYELEPTDAGTRVMESWDISQEVFSFLVRPLRGVTRTNMEKTLARLDALVTR